MRVAPQSDESKGDFRETDGNAVAFLKCGCRSRSRRLGGAIGKSDRSSSRSGKPISLRPKGGDQSEIAVVRGSQFEKNSPDDGLGGKAYAWRCPKAGGMHLPQLPWVPTLEQRTVGALLSARSRIGL